MMYRIWINNIIYVDFKKYDWLNKNKFQVFESKTTFRFYNLNVQNPKTSYMSIKYMFEF
jgi:hypothetical protein